MNEVRSLCKTCSNCGRRTRINCGTTHAVLCGECRELIDIQSEISSLKAKIIAKGGTI